MVTSFQSAVNAEDIKLYGAQVATHRAKALQQQKESKTAQGQRFAAKGGKPQGQRINTYHYTYKLFKALLLCIWWSRALSLSIKNVQPFRCKTLPLWLANLFCKTLSLWLATLCRKALPLCSSALLVLRRAFLSSTLTADWNELTASYHEIIQPIHQYTFLSASLLIWLSLCIVFCHRTGPGLGLPRGQWPKFAAPESNVFHAKDYLNICGSSA